MIAWLTNALQFDMMAKSQNIQIRNIVEASITR
jgi:hypothetical protein